MSVYQWLCVLAVPNLVFLLWSTVINRRMKKRDEAHEELRQQNDLLEAQNKATMLGVQALLRDRLLQAFKIYLQQGYADYSDRDNVRNMYEQYEALGPNSVMSDLYSQFTELPMQL